MINILLPFLLSTMSFRKQLLTNINTKSYGPFIMSGSPNIAELLAGIGYNHVIVDMEHSPLDVSSTVPMLRAIDASRNRCGNTNNDNNNGVMPIVRVPSLDVANTKRILDILQPPCGIMFPMIENAEQASIAVKSTRYPPLGVRGCAHPYVRASQYGNDSDYFYKTSKDLLVIVQVESKDAIENIPEIGMVDGVDCIFLGPFDISCSVGKMGQFEKGGEVMDVLRHAERLVRETSEKKKELNMQEHQNDEDNGFGLILGGFRSPGRSLNEMFAEEVGYQLVAGSADLGMIQNAARVDYLEAKRAVKKK